MLEAMSILSGWGGLDRCRENLVTWGSEEKISRLYGQTDEGDLVEAHIGEKTAFRFAEKRISATTLRQKTPLLMFLPQDMELVEGGAAARRRILDIALSLIVPSYAYRLAQYRRAVKQKTIVLKSQGDTRAIDRVTEPLAEWIWSMRGKFLDLLQEELSKNNLSPCPVCMRYIKGGTVFKNIEKQSYAEALALQCDLEKRLRYPLVGPHRDEVLLFTEGKLAKNFLSRGQRRRVVISIMLATSDTIKRKLGQTPILLLDEIMSDLDNEARGLLLQELAFRGGQICATTTEAREELLSQTEIRTNVLKIVDGAVE